jgi:Domain of unknown function (DUF6795)
MQQKLVSATKNGSITTHIDSIKKLPTGVNLHQATFFEKYNRSTWLRVQLNNFRQHIKPLFLCALITQQGFAMSLFSSKKEPVVLFSEMEGHLIYKRKPAANAKITLWYKWKDKLGESVVYSADENGYFSIPTIRDQYKPRMLAQLVITQRLTVSYNNEEYVIWALGKMTGNYFDELGGEAINVVCDLADDLKDIDDLESDALLTTSCRWDAISASAHTIAHEPKCKKCSQ